MKSYLIAGTIASVLLFKYRLSLLGKNYQKRIINSAFLERFDTKYKPQKDNNAIGNIFPTNIYDMQKLFQIATQYKIPIINDIHYHQRVIPFQHIRLDLEKFNKVISFNEKESRIKVNSGIKIKDLIKYLRDKGYTIKHLEHLENTSLCLSDVLFNHYYSLNQGKLLNSRIDEYTLLIPKEEKILMLKPSNDFSFNHSNYNDMFLYSNSVIGVILDVQLKIEKLSPNENTVYLRVISNTNLQQQTFNQTINEIYNNYSRNPLIEDVIVKVSKDLSFFDIYLKINSKYFSIAKAILSQSGIKLNMASPNEIKQISDTENDSHSSLRKAKIIIPEMNEMSFMNKLFKLVNKEENKSLKPSITFSAKFNQIDLSLPLYEDINLIEKEYFLLRDLYKLVYKTNGNIYLNSNVVLNPKCDLTQEIGFNNYIINEDLKFYFDPLYILNPNLSIYKPNYVERLKRRSKIINYLFTTLKI